MKKSVALGGRKRIKCADSGWSHITFHADRLLAAVEIRPERGLQRESEERDWRAPPRARAPRPEQTATFQLQPSF